LKRKKGAFVGVAGPDQEFSAFLATVKGFFCWTKTELVKLMLYSHEVNDLGKVKKQCKDDRSLQCWCSTHRDMLKLKISSKLKG